MLLCNSQQARSNVRRHVSRRLSSHTVSVSQSFLVSFFSLQKNKSLSRRVSLCTYYLPYSQAHPTTLRCSHFFTQKHCWSIMFRAISRRAAPLLLRQQQRSAGPATARLSYYHRLATAATSSSFQNTSPARKTNQQQDQQRRSVFIQTESTPNPESLKFVPTGKAVLDNEDGTGYFVSKTDPLDDILRSPLCKELFKVEGVKGKYL